MPDPDKDSRSWDCDFRGVQVLRSFLCKLRVVSCSGYLRCGRVLRRYLWFHILAGWGLTDETEEPDKHLFPAGTSLRWSARHR